MKLCLIAFIVAILGGCTTITYTAPNMASVTIKRIGYDTKIGSLEGSMDPKTGAVHVKVENFDSTARALDVAQTALEVLKQAP